MRDQLIRYVELLFAGNPESYDIQQEILQNTLDKYDDLVAQGKAPEAAYRLAISGIGDIGEILGSSPIPKSAPAAAQTAVPEKPAVPAWKKAVRAAAIFLYILCPIPLFVLSELNMATIGLCGTLGIVAVATALMVMASGKNSDSPKHDHGSRGAADGELRKAISSVIWAVGLCVYFVLSFSTGCWHITWLIFPILGAVQGLVTASLDLKEAKHEK